MNNGTKKGFTLVELLVVISIIALLLSILMPSLSKARSLARRVVCSSNFKQVGIIHHLYANDYGKLIRFVQSWEDRNANVGEPIGSIVPYLMPVDLFEYCKESYGTEAKFWICPSFAVQNRKGHWANIDKGANELPQWLTNSEGVTGPVPCYYVGMANITGLANLVKAVPGTVKESALKPTDRSDRLLAVDLNIRWAGDWRNEYTLVSHPGKKGGLRIPSGGNRLHLGGSVNWVNNSVMARGDTPITDRARGRYDHWKGGEVRDYFW